MQSEKLESIQKRALRAIFPTAETYKDALNLAGLETLASRTYLYEKYMNKMRCTSHPLNMLLPRRYEKSCEYAQETSQMKSKYIRIINFVTQRDCKNFIHLNIFKYCKYF